ncbi:MAG TPA: PAS domain-containing protein, partial [Burkholderiales bacterium]|nr:PAS domain-containing protein [Burkholderiales bacterium]
MLQSCAELLVRHLDVALARIWTLDRGGTVLELHASAGMYTHINGAHARVPVGVHKIGLIAQEQRPYITNEVASDPRIHDKGWAQREALVSFAGYPLIVEDCVVGVMAMFARHRLPEGTLDTLCSIASTVAQGIERKRADERLRRSEAYLAEGQRLSHTGSWARNLRTDERYWSKEEFRIYGFEDRESPPPREEVLARVHPDDQQTVRRILEDSLREGRDFRFETRVRIPGRPQKWVETVGHPVRDERGHVVEFLGTDIDVSAQKRANRLLRRAIRGRYAAALQERMRLARDMHDGLLQDITGIALQLRALLPHVRDSPESSAQRLEEILELTERTSREARQAIVGMRASQSDDDLVVAVDNAVRRVAAQSALAVTVTVSGQSRSVSPEIRDAASAIAQEAVTNVVKHAGASSAR